MFCPGFVLLHLYVQSVHCGGFFFLLCPRLFRTYGVIQFVKDVDFFLYILQGVRFWFEGDCQDVVHTSSIKHPGTYRQMVSHFLKDNGSTNTMCTDSLFTLAFVECILQHDYLLHGIHQNVNILRQNSQLVITNIYLQKIQIRPISSVLWTVCMFTIFCAVKIHVYT